MRAWFNQYRQLRVLTAAVLLAGLLIGLAILSDRELHFSLVALAHKHGAWIGYGLMVLAALAGGLVPPALRRWVLLGVTVVAYPLLLGAGALAIGAYIFALCGIARLGIKLRYQLFLALGLWLALPLVRIYLWSLAWQQGTLALAIVWTGLAYSTVYLLIERKRHDPPGPSLIDDLFYLLALPRLVEPFFQPISQRYLYSCEDPQFEIRLLLRGFLLGLYGAAIGVLTALLKRWDLDGAGLPLRLTVDFLIFYGIAAQQIFISIALFRLMGFDLASGFRQPFLARSFADFFRRWNHYVRDALLSLFFFPFLGWLRRHLSHRAATIVAAYLAIIVGSLLMNDLLVPFATSAKSVKVSLMPSIHPLRLLVLVVYWSAIVLPGRFLAPSRRSTSVQVARFLVLFGALWVGTKLLGQSL